MDLNNRKEYGPVSHKRDDNKETNNAYKFLPTIPLRKNFYKKKWFIISSIVVSVALVGAVAGWVLINSNNSFIETLFPNEQAKIDAKNEVYNQKVKEADVLVNRGDFEDGIAAYDELIETIDDAYKKSTVLISKANIYYNRYDYEKALEVAKEAEAINSNYNVSYFLANLYNSMYDYENALDYYTKSIESLDMSQPTSEVVASYIQSQIDETKVILSGKYASEATLDDDELFDEEVDNE